MRAAAKTIEDNKLGIIDEWVEKVRMELTAPNKTTDPVLRDHLPLLLDDIVAIMKRYDSPEFNAEFKSYEGIVDNSVGHGRHRSSDSGYDVEQVLKEYIILHRIITEKLTMGKSYSTEVADVLKYIMENSMLYAVVAFNNSLQEMQQKMISVLAHDIRNPVSAAHLGLGMLKQEDSPDRFEKVVRMTKNSINRSLELLEGLLESVTVEAGEGMTLHFSERDLADYIRSVHDDLSEIYSNEIILKCGEQKIMGVFDSAMVRRVLENIINNAVKYGERGTPVTITVEGFTEEVSIGIHNRGNPIPKEHQKDIFEFLKTSKGSGPLKLKSWGLGLSLVKVVARAHGGHLELDSNEENGTTFTITLGKYANKPGKLKTALNLARGHN